MPQMSPLNWLMLLLFFLIMFMLFNIMTYYLFIPSMNKLNNAYKYKKINTFNWKW